MLQKLRDKTSGWIATAILGLLIIPFAFVGIEQYMGARTDTSVAHIDVPPSYWQSAPSWWPVSMLWQHEKIDSTDFRTAFEQERQRRRAAEGEAFDARDFESKENKLAILDLLIDRRVQELASKSEGLVVSDALVKKTLAEVPAFQVDGKFNLDRYRLALASQVPPQTPTQFQETVRQSLQQSLLAGGLVESEFVTSAELDRLIRLMGETRDVGLVMLPQPAPDTGAVSAAELQSWYQGHSADYRAPETVTLEYVEVNAASVPPPAPADEDTLRKRYELEKSRFVAQEQRLASHILVRVADGADAAAQKAAEQKATQLTAQAKAAGADFAALARANSDDTGSKAGGGDLGWVSKGMMVAPFEQALFAAPQGAIVGPVKTDFGWHVIQVREVKAGQPETYEQAREALAREQAEADSERVVSDFTGRLVDLVYKNPSSLGPAAREMKLPVQKLGPLTRNGARSGAQGLAANPALLRAAFSDALIQGGTVSDPIEIAPGNSVLIRVTAHTPERSQPLAQVRDQVIAAVRADRATKAATKEADALLARLRGGETLEAVATSKQLPAPHAIPNLPRGAPIPDPSVSEAVFAVAPPAAGKVTPGRAMLPDGRAVLFAVSKVTPGDLAQVPPPQREQMQTQLAQISGADDIKALVAAQRKRMKVTVVDQNL
ncbi:MULTISPECIES: peptidylprolyl isomerase [unclassified Lysobacter]|uniref:peptidylprolyl isomerase n=1 Tax=unclassified Lysobacter TaxID=2635362 RepID=UPI0006FF29B7|nr:MULTISPECIES: peptidylprolyl isomerase [unclassified Lysobacter]KRA20158.1 peptidylprolyl isomerase [Lysobacter sp. Root604]KRD39167.1 peptidylprolyl isomerase [Lysobacter sp. Root916]KRD74686.1 peptidylprolyl isomerase [Lysobacter sp. Root983]